MNLGHGVTQTYIEPAWHKALTAFLVNTASSTGKDLVSNALAQDYGAAARAQGLAGAPGEDDKQSFASKVLQGPNWDKARFKEAQQAKTDEERYKAQIKHWSDLTGLSEKQLQEQVAARQAAEGRHLVELGQSQQKIDAANQANKLMEDRLNRELAIRAAHDAGTLSLAERQFADKSSMTPYEIAELKRKTQAGAQDFSQNLELASASAGVTAQARAAEMAAKRAQAQQYLDKIGMGQSTTQPQQIGATPEQIQALRNMFTTGFTR